MGRVWTEIFDTKLKKNQSNPKITHKNTDQPEPDLTMLWVGRGPTFFDPKPEVTRPDPTDDQVCATPSTILTCAFFFMCLPTDLAFMIKKGIFPSFKVHN